MKDDEDDDEHNTNADDVSEEDHYKDDYRFHYLDRNDKMNE